MSGLGGELSKETACEHTVTRTYKKEEFEDKSEEKNWGLEGCRNGQVACHF